MKPTYLELVVSEDYNIVSYGSTDIHFHPVIKKPNHLRVYVPYIENDEIFRLFCTGAPDGLDLEVVLPNVYINKSVDHKFAGKSRINDILEKDIPLIRYTDDSVNKVSKYIDKLMESLDIKYVFDEYIESIRNEEKLERAKRYHNDCIKTINLITILTFALSSYNHIIIPTPHYKKPGKDIIPKIDVEPDFQIANYPILEKYLCFEDNIRRTKKNVLEILKERRQTNDKF